MKQFQVGNILVHVFPSEKPGAPVVYLHGLGGFALDVWPILKAQASCDLSLVTITLPLASWSVDLAPWSTPAGWPEYVACFEGAPAYLKTFLNEIVKPAEKMLDNPSERILAGYSLAGLFALWAVFKTPIFDKIACASGSFWFPGFEQWFFDHSILKMPSSVFFSCSEEEYDTDNEYLKAEKPTLDHIYDYFKKQNVPTTLVLDPGDHYQDVLERTANAILWTLSH